MPTIHPDPSSSSKYVASPAGAGGTSPSLSYHCIHFYCKYTVWAVCRHRLQIHWPAVVYIGKQTAGAVLHQGKYRLSGLVHAAQQPVTGRCLAKPGQKSRKIHEDCTVLSLWDWIYFGGIFGHDVFEVWGILRQVWGVWVGTWVQSQLTGGCLAKPGGAQTS